MWAWTCEMFFLIIKRKETKYLCFQSSRAHGDYIKTAEFFRAPPGEIPSICEQLYFPEFKCLLMQLLLC